MSTRAAESRAPDTKENVVAAVAVNVVLKEAVAGITTDTAAADNKA